VRRLAVAIAAAAVLPVLLAGCGGSKNRRDGPAPVPTRSSPPDEALIQRALDAREERVPAGLGVRDTRLTVQMAEVDGDRARVTARLSYRVRGVRGGFGGTRVLRARRTASGWRIAGRVGKRDRAPWEADDYVRTRSRHFVIWMPEGLDAGPLPAALEDGYARMRGILDRGTLRRRYLVVVARDPAAALRLTAHIRGLAGLTALTDTQVRQAGAAQRVHEVASQRLLVVWPSFTGLDADQQRTTVAHELTHAALAPVTSGRVPGWLSEGVAMYVSGDDRTSQAAQLAGAGQELPTLRSLSEPDAIGRLRGDAQVAAYAYASAAAFAIAQRFGRDKLLALYDAFNRDRIDGPAGDPAVTSAAALRVLGTSLRGLDREVRASLP
jgi:hypothetical protein